MDTFPLDLEAPELLQALELFSEKILNPDTQLLEFEQIIAAERRRQELLESTKKDVGVPKDQSTGLVENIMDILDSEMSNEEPVGYPPHVINTSESESESETLPIIEPEFKFLTAPISPVLYPETPIRATPQQKTVSKIDLDLKADLFDSWYDPYDAWNSPESFGSEIFPELF